MQRCVYCQAELPAGARFCRACGRAQPANTAETPTVAASSALTRPCPNCGEPLPLAARFCANCGRSLSAEIALTPGLGAPEHLPGAPGIPGAPAGPQSGGLSVPHAPAGPQSGGFGVPGAPAGPQSGAPTVPGAPAGPQSGAPGLPNAPGNALPAQAGNAAQFAGKTATRGLAPKLLGTAAGKIIAAVVAVMVVATGGAVIVAAVKGNNPPQTHSGAGSTAGPTSAPKASPTPSLSQQNVYVRARDGIYALNASNGSQRWHYTISTSFPNELSQLHVVDGAIYFILDKENDNDLNASTSTMYVLNAQEGTLLRQYALPYFFLESGSYIPDFTVVNGVIYLSAPQVVFAVTASNGSPLWQHTCECRSASAPIVVNNVVYYVTGVSIIEALNVSNGQLLWSYNLETPPPGSLVGNHPLPAISNNTMYVVGWFTNMVYAVSLNMHTPHLEQPAR